MRFFAASLSLLVALASTTLADPVAPLAPRETKVPCSTDAECKIFETDTTPCVDGFCKWH